MNIPELDEWQGITADMVREWLDKEGVQRFACPSFPVCPELGEHTHHGPTINSLVTIPDDLFGNRWQAAIVSSSVGWLALQRGLSVQALIREINPRMRKGMPSAAAIAAHEVSGGNWLAQSAQKGGVLRVLNWSISDHRAKLNTLDTTQKIPRDMVPDSWCFWPCDEHGNKVRWPTDADGKML